MRLIDRFTPLFALALDIHSSPVTASNKHALKEAVFNAVAKEQSAQVSTGITLEDMDRARTAVYFFIDEILMDEILIDDISIYNNTTSTPPKTPHNAKVKLAWYQNSLQSTYLHTQKGGELFFVYFEQILDKILTFAPQNTDTSYALPSTIQASTMSYNTQTLHSNVHDKFLRVSQLVAGTDIQSMKDVESMKEKKQSYEQNNLGNELGNTQQNIIHYVSACETLQVYAKCLLYGFRGKYYEHTHQAFLKELRNTAYSYLHLDTQENEDIEKVVIRAHTQERTPMHAPLHRKSKLGYFFYLACPPLLCAIWYFYCAQTVSQILL